MIGDVDVRVGKPQPARALHHDRQAGTIPDVRLQQKPTKPDALAEEFHPFGFHAASSDTRAWTRTRDALYPVPRLSRNTRAGSGRVSPGEVPAPPCRLP